MQGPGHGQQLGKGVSFCNRQRAYATNQYLSGPLCNIGVTSLTRCVNREIEDSQGIPQKSQRLLNCNSVLKDMQALTAHGISPMNTAITFVQVIPQRLYALGGGNTAKAETFDYITNMESTLL